MKTYAYSLLTFGSGQIRIGRQGENLATRIDVDVTPWKTEYPTGTISLFVVPPVGNGYLAALEENGNTIRWTIRDTDTAYDGHGKAELILKDASGTVIKSVTAYTICAKSPSAAEPADPPEAIRPWVEQILEAIKNGDVSAEAIAAAVESYIQEHGVTVEETDPNVPDWAKQPSKPTYTASEVGARPDTWMPSAADVGADAAGTASGAVAAHNVSGTAHTDLRALIEGLTGRLNALADSDDTTLDQLSEIVAYIKSNKALIDAVTTGKVSASDIVDNLMTNASGKVLSAAQGVALKAMIDGIVIPTALPNPQPITINGQRYDGSKAVTVTTVEIDDTLTQSGKAADAKAVGDQLSALNQAKANNDDLAAVAKSGSYNDLANKPTIPTVPSALPNPNALTFTGAVNETYDGSAAKSVAIPTVPESLKNPNKLTFTGAVTAEYDGSAPVSVEIPAGGGPAYELPVASPTTLGGVMPVEKAADMTQEVGVDAQGRLWTKSGGGVKRAWRNVAKIDFAECLNNGVNSFSFDVNDADCIQLSCYGPKNDHESTNSGLNVMFETTGGFNSSVGHYSLIKTTNKNGSIYYYDTVTTFDGGKAFVIKGEASNAPGSDRESGAKIMYGVTKPVSGYVKRIHSSWGNTDGSFGKLIDGYIDIWAREVVE